MPFSDDIKTALLGANRKINLIAKIVKCFETGDWSDCPLLKKYKNPKILSKLSRFYMDSVNMANHFFRVDALLPCNFKRLFVFFCGNAPGQQLYLAGGTAGSILGHDIDIVIGEIFSARNFMMSLVSASPFGSTRCRTRSPLWAMPFLSE